MTHDGGASAPTPAPKVHEAPAEQQTMAHEKIKLLLDIYEQDRKQTMLFVSFCFLLPGLTLAQIKSPTEIWVSARLILFFSLALFIIAGLLFLRYVRWQNWIRLGAKDAILSLDPLGVKEKLTGPNGLYARFGQLYEWGARLLWIAAILYVGFLVLYFFPTLLRK